MLDSATGRLKRGALLRCTLHRFTALTVTGVTPWSRRPCEIPRLLGNPSGSGGTRGATIDLFVCSRRADQPTTNASLDEFLGGTLGLHTQATASVWGFCF